jgi:RHS repeat-associated protein
VFRRQDWVWRDGYGSSNNGNVQSQTIFPLGATQSYFYDNVNRLTQMQEGANVENYGYDRWGNRWVSGRAGTLPAVPTGVPVGAGSYLTNNRIGPGSACGPTGVYDCAGNLRDLLGTTADYDGENRVKSAVKGGTAVTYAYDGDGRRVKSTVGAVSTVFVYTAFGQLAAEYGAGPAEGRKYLYADALGSTRLESCAGCAQTVKRFDYLPFGEEMSTSSRTAGLGYGLSGSERVKFTGKERDVETGLDYFGARYMSAAQGRFTSPDLPANYLVSLPQSWNKYTYALNNPLAIVDPDGQFPKWVHEQIIDQIPGLSPNDKAILKAASADADSFLKGGQRPSASFTHAMLNGMEFNSSQTDPEKAARFVESQLRKAIGIQAAYAANHRNQVPSLSPDALYAMGLAIHTVTDSASRFHNGASSYWYGGLSLMDYFHSAAEPLFYSMGGAKDKQEGVQRAEVTSRIIFQPSAIDQVVNKIRQWFHLKQKHPDELDQQ